MSRQKDMDNLFELVPTLETRFAPLSHLPCAAFLVCSRSCRANKWKLKRRGERVSLEAARRTVRRKQGDVIQSTNGEAKENANVCKRMSARQCAQKTPRYLKRRRVPIEHLRLALHDGINRIEEITPVCRPFNLSFL